MVTTSLVPSQYPVAINGRPFMVDPTAFQSGYVETLRAQADQSREFGEQSLTPDGFWRRTQNSWHGGAGDREFDGDTSEVQRDQFLISTGIDPWTRGQAKLLSSTKNVMSTGISNILKLVTANDVLYVANIGAGSYRTLNPSVSDPVSVGSPINDMASSGTRVWFATNNGIRRVFDGVFLAIQGSGEVKYDTVAFVSGRLMASRAHWLYNFSTDDSSGTAPDPLNTFLVQPGWRWNCWGSGLTHIYAGGYAGDKSAVYKITIRDDGTALGAPSIACQLPDGEIIRCITGYIGVVVLGTSLGFRIATISGGNLTYGPLVEINGGVHALEPQGRFVWFTWGNQEQPYSLPRRSGVGRMDLSYFPRQPLVPAYANDMLAEDDNREAVRSVATYRNTIVFAIDGNAIQNARVYRQDLQSFVTEGWLVSGSVGFDLAEDKIFTRFNLRMAEGLGAGAKVEPSIGPVAFTTVGRGSTLSYNWGLGLDGFVAGASSDTYTVGLHVFRGTNAALTPKISRWTLSVVPKAPSQVRLYSLPLIFREAVRDLNAQDQRMDPWAELEALQVLREGTTFVDLQLFDRTFQAVVDMVSFGDGESTDYERNLRGLQGICIVRLKVYL